jgi:hypothetical protein
MFDTKNLWKYVTLVAIISVASYYSKKMISSMDDKEENEYKLIQRYLLNESPLYGYNKPKIWIHTKYEINARKWKSFHSRNSYDLNQPYIHITIQSIINYCSDDFHICLIDDDTFSKLIPTWNIDMATTPEPKKTQYRQLGLAQLLYYYGGMVVPPTFLCTRNLKDMYESGTIGNKPFVCEAINRTENRANATDRLAFIPDTYFMGSAKNNVVMLEYMDYLKYRSLNSHFTQSYEFVGDTAIGCVGTIVNEKMNLIKGDLIGIKTARRKPIMVEELMEDNFLDMNPNMYGIYIPEDEILKRPKYQWFAVLTKEQMMESNFFLANYMKASIVDAFNAQTSGLLKSGTAI